MPTPLRSMKTLETPSLIILEPFLQANVTDAASLAHRHGVALRPHIKTHKCPSIAALQAREGAVGFTTATLGEAESLFDAGFQDVFIAYPIVGEGRLRHLETLMPRGRLIVAADHSAQIPMLAEAANRSAAPLHLRIEIDCGHHRCGLEPGPAVVSLAREIAAHPNLRLEGVFTHAGHGYGATSSARLAEIGQAEGDAVVTAASMLREAGFSCPSVSAGSTPTLPYCAAVAGVTEVRPGNYVFNDGIQIALGVATPERCALRVLTTVIAVFPDRFIIDAGSKAFGLDKGAHGLESAKGYGRIIGYEECELARLSEEHGIVVPPAGSATAFPKIGDQLQIIPNHACAAANLSGEYFVLCEPNGEIRDRWRILGRR